MHRQLYRMYGSSPTPKDLLSALRVALYTDRQSNWAPPKLRQLDGLLTYRTCCKVTKQSETGKEKTMGHAGPKCSPVIYAMQLRSQRILNPSKPFLQMSALTVISENANIFHPELATGASLDLQNRSQGKDRRTALTAPPISRWAYLYQPRGWSISLYRSQQSSYLGLKEGILRFTHWTVQVLMWLGTSKVIWKQSP